jgi:hypothetical protein
LECIIFFNVITCDFPHQINFSFLLVHMQLFALPQNSSSSPSLPLHEYDVSTRSRSLPREACSTVGVESALQKCVCCLALIDVEWSVVPDCLINLHCESDAFY